MLEILQRNGENSDVNLVEKVSVADQLDVLDSKIDVIGEAVEWMKRKLEDGGGEGEDGVVFDEEMTESADGDEIFEDSDPEKDVGSSKRCSTPTIQSKPSPTDSPDVKDPKTGRYPCSYCPTTFLQPKSMKVRS